MLTILTQVVENVCEELTRLFSCVASFSENGCSQAALDVAAFEQTVQGFLSPNSKYGFKFYWTSLTKVHETYVLLHVLQEAFEGDS